jgi:drug/metabolite transporter (DMT)-like permease
MVSSRKPLFDKGTLSGLAAILLWSTLALLTIGGGDIPPFQKAGTAFSIAAVSVVLKWLIRRESPSRYLRIPLGAWGLGVFGLFGFHFLYFVSLRLAPPLEASLIVYLWPLLIILLSALVTQIPLRWWQFAGAILGFLGTVLIATRGNDIKFDGNSLLGYLCALCCALVWATYSVANRKYREVPTDSVGGFCAISALLAWTSHFVLETTVGPSAEQWLALGLMGLGPMGVAFFLWDYGVKNGNLIVLGTLSYLSPLLSTLLLLVSGRAAADARILIACFLIVGGSLLGSFAGKSMASKPI